MRYILILIVLTQCYFLNSQCNYLAYDGFDYNANLAMQGMTGGTGWAAPWNVQNNNTTVPGFSVQANSLPFNDLQTAGNSASGGFSYLTMGRRLDSSESGPFSDYVSSGNDGIGTTTGDVLWTSFMLSKDSDNDQPVFVSLHSDETSWYHHLAGFRIAAGYFDSNSNSGGQRYWSLLLNNTYHLSSIPVVIGEPTLLVIRTNFNAGDTQVDFYINPATIGDKGIPASAISQSTGGGNVIKSMATFLGNMPGNGSVDEIRMGTSYSCVTPDSDVVLNLPPSAAISMTPRVGISPLTVTLQGSGSSDPENGTLTYLWDFGDGSPTSELMNPPDHIYDEIGEIIVTLTVTDNIGQQQTSYETLTLLDADGAFPCQSTITCVQMASCNADNGILRVNAGGNTFELKNSSDQILATTMENEYHNLPAGNYSLKVNGESSSCSDSFNLQIRTDSTTCLGWQPAMCSMDIGTNITGLADWSVERPFRNLMKNVRPGIITFTYGSDLWDANVVDEMSIDSDGYPTSLPQTTSIGATNVRYVLSSEGGNLRPDSTYVLAYDGIGNINIIGTTVISNNPNRLEFTAGSGNVIINIDQSTAGNYLRNFRLTTLGDENIDLTSEPFYASFIDKITPFKLLRFMDWGSTNNSPLTSWSDRASESYFTYGTGAGVPYEKMIQLANQQQQDIWICVPHQADNDYIMQMATLFRDGLDDNITIYLEYSNELWNWIFEQAHYNNDNKPSNLSYGRAMAEKAGNVFTIWHNVFAGQECRVKRVLGLQAGFNSLNEQILSQLESDEWDYGSPTHYFGLDTSALPKLNASSTYLDVMQNTIDNFTIFSQSVKQDYKNVQVYGKEVITYEGGQHFVGNAFGSPYTFQDAMWEAQNSPEMYDMYNAVHDSLRMWGCKLATNFSLSSVQESVFGSWGVLPDIDVIGPYSETARKYQALLYNIPDGNCSDVLTWNGDHSISWSNPCNWDRNRVPLETDNIVIPVSAPHPPSVDMNAHAKSIIISAGAVLTILTGWDLTVE